MRNIENVPGDPEAIKLSLGDLGRGQTSVRFEIQERVEPFLAYHETLLDLIARCGARDVCDAGGGANPELAPPEIADLGLRYTVLDLSAEELKKAGPAYSKVVADIADAEPPQVSAFDLVFSRMLAEHIRDGAAFHRNVFRMLRPNGLAFHFFPTLYALPFVANRIFPEKLASSVLSVINPDRDLQGHQVKFPAYYSWCRGPTPRQICRLESVGFEVLDFVGFFGHRGYYSHLPLLLHVHRKISAFLCRHQMAWQTSFAFVLLRKPA